MAIYLERLLESTLSSGDPSGASCDSRAVSSGVGVRDTDGQEAADVTEARCEVALGCAQPTRLCDAHASGQGATAPSSMSREYAATVGRYASELRGVAIRMTKCAQEGEDLVQEAALRAWKHWDQIEVGSNRRAWLHAILRNAYLNRRRRSVRERAAMLRIMEDLDPEVIVSASALDGEMHSLGDEVDAALAALPQEYRTVVVRVDLEDASYREVAEALGCPVGTVMSRLYRGRSQLKTALRQYADNEGYLFSRSA